MKKYKYLFWVAAFILVTSCMTESVRAAEPYEKIANSNEWKVLQIVNKERIDQGLEPLSMFSSLQKAAGMRAEEVSYYFSHERPDGTSCFTAIKEQGIDYRYAGENIAVGYTDPADVMNGWMNSSGHRSNILGSAYSHIGIGYCTGGDYGRNWTQSFVGGCKVRNVSINDEGTANYPVGTSIDSMERYLIVRCSDHGVGYLPITSGMCSGYNANKTGYQKIFVRYRGKKVDFSVTVGQASSCQKPLTIKGLAVSGKTATSVSLCWDKQSGNGYEIWSSTSKNGTYKKVQTLKKASRTSYKVKNLEAGEKYYFKIRAYKKLKNKKIYGLFSKAVVVKTK